MRILRPKNEKKIWGGAPYPCAFGARLVLAPQNPNHGSGPVINWNYYDYSISYLCC